MDDRVLALCELSNDLLFHKIPRERLAYYVDASLEAGRNAARLFLGQDVRELYRQNGIEIRYAGSGKQNYGVILRGQSSSIRILSGSWPPTAPGRGGASPRSRLWTSIWPTNFSISGSTGSAAPSRRSWNPLSVCPSLG